eukprot:CAMPEP_0194495418 /NCGR_PEP_ID=MMETSP0253-20130528/13020_1 /TAXON_ID=2966 /ORGANISM="Noctiluca scintillans" /LENGTH=437 /DNA_ID=CAMNT_0039336669 /DNA_START=45 /DNA_END=1358 /DNA_ORIENTATION=+
MLATLLNPVSRMCCCAPQSLFPCSGAEDAKDYVREYCPTSLTSEELLHPGKPQLGVLPLGPKVRSVPTYCASEEEALRGEPLCEGAVLFRKPDDIMREMQLSIYVNGFSLTPRTDAGVLPVRKAWSPFSLVEKCAVKTLPMSSSWGVFKLTVFRAEGGDRCYYFATAGADAASSRDRWLAEMASGIRTVTCSLFPPYTIAVRPVFGVASTSTRILAGYLLQSKAPEYASLLYCELHAYSGGHAKLSMYKDEWCEEQVACLTIAETTVVTSRKGIHCSIFGVDSFRFCARTSEEKELWLRAVTNVKVKLLYEAPDPTNVEIGVFRAAVQERVSQLERKELSPGPLLQPVPRVPTPMTPRGDVWTPVPAVDEQSDRPRSPSPNCAPERQATLQPIMANFLNPEECKELVGRAALGLNSFLDVASPNKTGQTVQVDRDNV